MYYLHSSIGSNRWFNRVTKRDNTRSYGSISHSYWNIIAKSKRLVFCVDLFGYVAHIIIQWLRNTVQSEPCVNEQTWGRKRTEKYRGHRG